MKTGKTLIELAQEIKRQRGAKRDLIADTREIAVTSDLRLRVGGDAFGIAETAHNQIANATGIPVKYYDRMRAEDPSLCALNANAWFKKEPERRMVRTLDGAARAFLSDRYQRIDNEHIAEVVLPVLAETPGIRIASAEITERKLYIKAVNERVRSDVKVGDPVEAGVLITNSEIGHGAVAISPLVHRLVCLNGMVVADQKYRRNHVGRRADTTEAVYEMLSDETRRADDKAILLKVRDIVKAALDEARFAVTVEKMREAATGEKMADPVRSIEELGRAMGLAEGEKRGVLHHLIEGGDLTKWGMLNAVTRAAQDVESYDRSTDLEAVGGRILDLNNAEWRELAMAA